MTKEKIIDFEAIASGTRKEALEQAHWHIEDDPEDFKNRSKREIELFLETETDRFVREAKMYSEYIHIHVGGAENVKARNMEVFNRHYGEMIDKILFIMKGEKYTTMTQGALCAIMEVSPRHYRDVREKYKEQLDEQITQDITDITQHQLYDYIDSERGGFNRVLHELSLIGLPGVTEWSNHEATEAQEQAILKAIAGANTVGNSKLWKDCNVFEWYVLMSPDERVSNGCKV